MRCVIEIEFLRERKKYNIQKALTFYFGVAQIVQWN